MLILDVAVFGQGGCGCIIWHSGGMRWVSLLDFLGCVDKAIISKDRHGMYSMSEVTCKGKA